MISPPENLLCEQCHLTLPVGWHPSDPREREPDPRVRVLASATGPGSDYLPMITISDISRPMTMLLFRSQAPRIARDRVEQRGYYEPEGQPQPRWVTVGGHPAYQATYRYSTRESTRRVTELLTLDRVLSVGRASFIIWWRVSQDSKKVPSPSRVMLIRFVTSEEQHVDYGPDFQHMLQSWKWHAPKPPGHLRQFIWGGLPGLWLNRRPDRGGQAQRRMRTSWRFWLGAFFVLEGIISLAKSPGHPSNLGWAALGFIVGAALIFWAKKRSTGW
jgi:hypothetical protein